MPETALLTLAQVVLKRERPQEYLLARVAEIVG